MWSAEGAAENEAAGNSRKKGGRCPSAGGSVTSVAPGYPEHTHGIPLLAVPSGAMTARVG